MNSIVSNYKFVTVLARFSDIKQISVSVYSFLVELGYSKDRLFYSKRNITVCKLGSNLVND